MATVTISGHLGRTPELRYTANGQPILGLSVAENTRKDKDGPEETTWYDVAVWGSMAELYAPVLEKGMRVWVTGRLQVGTYTTNEGETRVRISIHADSLGYSTKRTNGQQDAPPPMRQPQPTPESRAPRQYPATPAASASAADDDPFGDQ